jgi:4-amino-4-deoxy-L-arabinose transferase-like glycosyltransferase
MDFGSAGTLRLFTEPLVGEASWLLPFVLGGLVVLAIALWKQPFGEQHLSVILWAGWLLPEAIYFTYSRGIMHAYYLIMMGAPIAALTALTVWGLWQFIQKRGLLGWFISAMFTAGTLAFQAYALGGDMPATVLAVGIAGSLFGVGVVLAAASRLRLRLAPVAMSLLLLAVLVAPTVWSTLTTFNSSPNGALPYAGPAQQDRLGGMPNLRFGNEGNQNLLDYLLANTSPGTYLLATGRSSDAATYILATGRPVLTFGGFLGQYDVVSVEQLAALVNSGQLRFVLSQGLEQHQEIAQWVQQNCTVVDYPSLSGANVPAFGNPGGPPTNANLYDCGSN